MVCVAIRHLVFQEWRAGAESKAADEIQALMPKIDQIKRKLS
jgi:hypothetical protein